MPNWFPDPITTRQLKETNQTLKMEEMAPGFRFFPTEEELVSFYLNNKLHNRRPELHRVIPELNIYDLEPWQLPQYAGDLCQGDMEQWFFFVPMQSREAQGGRPNRTTASGYWKATGSPGYVYSSSNRAIGVKKTMVFYMGRAPTGIKTKWKMNEYRAIMDDDPDAAGGSSSSSASVPNPKLKLEYCVCRVYVISGNFRAFDRRPPGLIMTSQLLNDGLGNEDGHRRVVTENEPNVLPQNMHLVGEGNIQEAPIAGEVHVTDQQAVDEHDMDCLVQFSRDQMNLVNGSKEL